MAPDGGRSRTAQAAQACLMCKTRKKKCNKLLPSCGYCTRKQLDCAYALVPRPRNLAASPTVESRHLAPFWGARPPTDLVSSRQIKAAKVSSDQSLVEGHQCPVYLQIHGVIRGTGQFVDDISARYFQGFHRHLPVISRTRFYNKLITLGVTPAADFSVLLLTICLITHAPAMGHRSAPEATPSSEQQCLYLTAKSLFAQVQVSCSPSVSLIQAALLIAVYEYTHGRPDDAFLTIAGSARLGYAARIHTHNYYQTQRARTADHSADNDVLLQAEEAANTWWGVSIWERICFSDVTVFEQPLVTAFPGGDARLPIEPKVLDGFDIIEPELIPNVSVSCLTSSKVGGYGRTAQATCLLDQVFKCLDAPDLDSRLLQLDRIDTSIQAFLSLVIPQCQGQLDNCTAINIAIRALFTLHCHILDQQPQAVRAMFKQLEEWQERSQDALNTTTKMVVDTAGSLIAATRTIDAMPPTYPYIARAALKHIHNSTQREDASWLRSAEDVLQHSLDKYFQRWSVVSEN